MEGVHEFEIMSFVMRRAAVIFRRSVSGFRQLHSSPEYRMASGKLLVRIALCTPVASYIGEDSYARRLAIILLASTLLVFPPLYSLRLIARSEIEWAGQKCLVRYCFI